MIEIKNVTKSYGPNTGNFDVNISIKDGEIYGLLGPNGAGKTTLIRQMMGFIKPDSGTISILGLDSWKQHKEIMTSLGYLEGEVELFDNLKGMQYIKMVADLKGMKDLQEAERLISYFQLNANTKIKKMSKGMKQKIAIICAVMNKPKVLILDEPTSGLDPLMQNQFNELIKSLNKQGTTIFLSSHIFQDVAQLCNRVGFLRDGKLIKEETIKDRNIEALQKEFLSLYKTKDAKD
ncbi:ABC transporter ATP-binding protein [Mesoplasma lactucae]|uniref:Multidrug ABC transporter ATP-binding protein n=1 Tax=Mesoplasma lactucae ATCC 49193 TaxID=81460 RepID=A0A291ISQ8_9MOLU|nr:ATP-binding cassette domain-containing protein [Mesoplasma lactucae]ATG97731.1 multidrug ABC transporter ATP-binding protein [Mesoplasma lactucae ATCC 49193]ATZ20492.1 ABC transporter ATP-binding protein [Mesoplasma lactucae ATCC 49193]MCL8216663.1 putative multidrug ABC transporter ATP-binding protein YbhF [Mesoplasma lactucae ATCC 49193]